jgi:site-specific recombinase XerD
MSLPDGSMAKIVSLRERSSPSRREGADRFFLEMTTSWRSEMTSRHLGTSYVNNRAIVVNRFRDHCETDPWEWRPEFMNLWSAELVAEGLSGSTIRSYQGAVRQFCEHITNPAYPWAVRCLELFGTHPVQICFEWNTTAHVEELECDPSRRPLTREEVRIFLEHLHERTLVTQASGHKGTVTAKRDYVFFAVIYAFGLRIDEACHLAVEDFSALAGFEKCGKFGQLHVRYAKANKGGQKRRRLVFNWRPALVTPLLSWYMADIRPAFPGASSSWCFLTERGGRLQPGSMQRVFRQVRDATGLSDALTPHCLRHSFCSHAIEDGVSRDLVSSQVGHTTPSTTSVYVQVSEEWQRAQWARANENFLGGVPTASKEPSR